ncbi:SSI family serine proteinase inhibitor [Streptomyces sp. NPDC018031]|uniref:SSI family serine proteinase inhibitor n=1 Tax=Streptomyces sp. NPDC018031 TaxID=3365033 RepID=UPI0037988484
MPPRRLALATAVTAAAMTCVPAAAAVPLPVPLPDRYLADAGRGPHLGPSDHLVVSVSGTGLRAHDGTYTVDCHPSGGSHLAARSACDRLDEVSRWGHDPFAPVPEGSSCTMQYGGPAVARVVGTWAGRPVNARFTRTDGCEIARWNRLVPLLPSARA